MKIENQSRKLSHKPDGVGRNRTVLLSSNFANESNAFDPVKTRLSESQAEAEEPTNPSTQFSSPMSTVWYQTRNYDADNPACFHWIVDLTKL